MKKFSFSLQKLLDYKEQLLENERMVLADMNAALYRMEAELQQMTDELVLRSTEYNLALAEGITPTEILIYSNYRRSLERSIEQKQIQIRFQNEAISTQTDKVRAAKIEVSTMEKLKEKKLEDYNYRAAKAEEQFIEEFVSNVKASAQVV